MDTLRAAIGSPPFPQTTHDSGTHGEMPIFRGFSQRVVNELRRMQASASASEVPEAELHTCICTICKSCAGKQLKQRPPVPCGSQLQSCDQQGKTKKCRRCGWARRALLQMSDSCMSVGICFESMHTRLFVYRLKSAVAVLATHVAGRNVFVARKR